MAVYSMVNPSGIRYGGATVKAVPVGSNREPEDFHHFQPGVNWVVNPGSGVAYFNTLDSRFKLQSSGAWENPG